MDQDSLPPEPVRVFIGTEPKTKVPCEVLKYSILQNTAHPVVFEDLDQRFVMPPKRWGTGFSLRRWMIPEFCNFEGRAIYLDADQLVIGDIWELWCMPHTYPGGPVWLAEVSDKNSPKTGVPSWQSSVMVIDCHAVRPGNGKTRPWICNIAYDIDPEHPVYAATLWSLLDGSRENYGWFMTCRWFDPPPTIIPTVWNSFNFHGVVTKLIHYTKESEQPWYRPHHPFRKLWEKWLMRALKAGAVTREDLAAALDFPTPKGRMHAHYRKHLA